MKYLKLTANMIIYFLLIAVPLVLIVAFVLLLENFLTYGIWMTLVALIMFLLVSLLVLLDLALNDPIIK